MTTTVRAIRLQEFGAPEVMQLRRLKSTPRVSDSLCSKVVSNAGEAHV